MNRRNKVDKPLTKQGKSDFDKKYNILTIATTIIVAVVFMGLYLNANTSDYESDLDSEELDTYIEENIEGDNEEEEVEVEEPVETPSTTPAGVNREAVYQYMLEKYNEVTNYGDNYVPETHDPMVARMASEVFGISESEAKDIFIEEDKERLGL